jgi:hypothetical protein
MLGGEREGVLEVVPAAGDERDIGVPSGLWDGQPCAQAPELPEDVDGAGPRGGDAS